MITKNVFHRDSHRYQSYCFLTWGVLNLDLYSRMNHSCNRDSYLMKHWNDSFEIMMNFRLLDSNQPIKIPYPKEQSVNQRHSLFHKHQVEWRALAATQYIKRKNHDFLWRRNQKLNSPVQQLKKPEHQLDELYVVLLYVTKDVSRSKSKLILYCCFWSSWVAPPFFLILARFLVIGYELGDKNGS